MLRAARLLSLHSTSRLPVKRIPNRFERVPTRALKHATDKSNSTSKSKTINTSHNTSHQHEMSKRTSYERSELGHTTTKRAKQVDEDLPYDILQEALGAQDEVKE